MVYSNLASLLAFAYLSLSVITQPLCYARPQQQAPSQGSSSSKIKRAQSARRKAQSDSVSLSSLSFYGPSVTIYMRERETHLYTSLGL